VRHARGLHLGPTGPDDVAALCDAWLAAGQRVTVFVVEVRGLDELGLISDEYVVAAALSDVAHRVAWAQPRRAQTAALSDRHLVIAVPHPIHVDVAELAARLHGLFDRPVEVEGRLARLSASIGIAEGPEDGGRLGVLAARARAVAARARASSSTTRFDLDALDRAALQMHLSSHVVWALQHDAIQVAFQPVVDARSGAVRSVEALVRCWHPDLGEVPTEQIVESAEQHGSSVELFRTVLRSSLFALRDWRAVGLLDSVSVNVAPHLLADPRTLEAIDEALQDTGVPASALLLEITEHVAMDDLVAHGVRFRERGVRIAIDDFGVGQSTVGRLAGLMVDVVKLDRSLVSGLDEDDRRERVVSLTNDVVHHLGAEVVAEGVETEPEAAALREAGIDGLQGFGVCRPLPYEAMSAYLEEMRRHRRESADD
jgi:EAL domain-containing protein (putative c-di-GMP-specific phosphodiesterase class I)